MNIRWRVHRRYRLFSIWFPIAVVLKLLDSAHLVLGFCRGPGWFPAAIQVGFHNVRRPFVPRIASNFRNRTIRRSRSGPSWLAPFEAFDDFMETCYDWARNGPQHDVTWRPLQAKFSGAPAKSVLGQIKTLLGAREATLGNKVGTLQTQMFTMNSRFTKIRKMLKESEEREIMLGMRLSKALAHEQALDEAVDGAQAEYDRLVPEADALRKSEEDLKQRIEACRERREGLCETVWSQRAVLEEEFLPIQKDSAALNSVLLETGAMASKTRDELSASQAQEVKVRGALDDAAQQIETILVDLADAKLREQDKHLVFGDVLKLQSDKVAEIAHVEDHNEGLNAQLTTALEAFDASNLAQQTLAGRLTEEMEKAAKYAAKLAESRAQQSELASALQKMLRRKSSLIESLDGLSSVGYSFN